MSFVKISDLTEKVTLAGTEEVLINDSGTSKKMATQRFLDVKTAAEAAQTAAEAAQSAAEDAQTAAELAETNAAQSESNASTSEGNAQTYATNASNSATAASNAQSAAETARDQTLTAFDNFDDRYLGTKASDPTLDNDGNALVAGALYFNSTDGAMKVYEGSAWVAAYASLSGALLATNNLSDLNDAATARTNLGLGTAATTASTDYATAAQGSTADSAVQPGDNVSDLTNDAGYLTGISGQSIEDLSDVATMTPSDGQLLTWNSSTSKWNSEDAPISLPDQTSQSGKYLTTNGTVASWDALATVANSGAYSDLSGTPTNVSTFTNDSGYITGNQTITLSGDVTGSGTTSISVTVADDSHNHIISNVDGLQTALDGKADLSGASFTGDLLPATDNTGVVGNATYTWSNGRFTKLTVDSTLSVRGAVVLADNDILRFGSSYDAEFFTNGSHFYLDLNAGIGNFIIRDGTTTRFTFDDAGHLTTTGDLTVSGGDITLGGTGRIQGIDTVSAGTDAANKNYVDTAVSGIAGSVLQVLQTVKTTEFSTTSTSYVTTGLSVSITPSSATNKILVIFSGATSGSAESAFQGVQLKRSGTVITTKDQRVHRSWEGTSSICFLDSPATTSSTTYEIFIKASSATTAYLNEAGDDDSTITVMEIAG